MNKRIRLLADEAAKFSAVMTLPTGESGDDLFVEKFAELLLKDVLVIVKNNTPDPYNEDYDERAAAERTANDIRDDIKYRFGVSE